MENTCKLRAKCLKKDEPLCTKQVFIYINKKQNEQAATPPNEPVKVEVLESGNVLTKKAAMARAKALPMDLLLEALDRRDIPYHATATRVQLETKLADELV